MSHSFIFCLSLPLLQPSLRRPLKSHVKSLKGRRRLWSVQVSQPMVRKNSTGVLTRQFFDRSLHLFTGWQSCYHTPVLGFRSPKCFGFLQPFLLHRQLHGLGWGGGGGVLESIPADLGWRRGHTLDKLPVYRRVSEEANNHLRSLLRTICRSRFTSRSCFGLWEEAVTRWEPTQTWGNSTL